MRGSVASIFALTLIACLWEVVSKGVLSPAALAGTQGTLLSPLAAQVGPVINWLGAVLVILGLGLTAIQDCLVLYYATDDLLPGRGSPGPIGRLDERSRFLLAGAPVVVSFLLTEWVSWSEFASFTTLQSILGVLQLPLMAGIYPVLLLLATRRKGDLAPRRVRSWLGNPLLLAGVYLVYLSIILIHVLIWQDLPSRLLAVIVGVTTLWMTVRVLRGGALAGRVVVELRQDQRPGGRSLLQVVQAGRRANLSASLAYPGREVVVACGDEIYDLPSLEALCLELPAAQARQLKVWAHRLTPEGRSEALPLRLEVLDGGRSKAFDLSGSGTATLAVSTWPCSIRLSRVSKA